VLALHPGQIDGARRSTLPDEGKKREGLGKERQVGLGRGMLVCGGSRKIVKTPSEKVDGGRRDFLRQAALGGLTALTVSLVARGSLHACVNEGLCPGCPAYDDCVLPRAASRKQALAKRAEEKP